jgi:hypothetical protein
MKRTRAFLMPAAILLLLAACGGGSNEGPTAQADPLSVVPASASQSSTGLAAYVSTLATLPADTREPVAVDTFNPPRPEDTEPDPVG